MFGRRLKKYIDKNGPNKDKINFRIK
jgi:hypothetical protein